MEHEVILPQLERTKKRTRIIEWRKREGDRVERGQVLFVAETDKGTYFYDAKVSGVLSKILVKRGEYVAMGSVVGIITTDGGDPV